MTERVLGNLDHADESPQEQDNQRKERDHAHEAKHAAHMREDEVGCLDLQEVLGALRSAVDAVPKQPAGTYGNARLNQVERLAGHVVFGIEERIQAPLLVVLETVLPKQHRTGD